ncbi:MAG: 16S rRNA (uracil(1498)-N(3))-methyltransferase [Candidatus Omnitrophica bacterium]|nr:16S rRNA (uracil(1498)-N(3))-methyltransferase [Candidatus Omnitrophota bacterium]
MSKIRVYIEPEKISEFIDLDEKGIIHKVKDVLRLKVNEELYIFDGKGREYLYEIKKLKNRSVLIEKKAIEKEQSLPEKKIILGFPFLKEEKIDFILQKATELGVFAFIPFICERSIRMVPSPNKLTRWKKIIIEAARQSERLWIPQIYDALDFKEIAKSNYKVKLVAAFHGSNLEEIINKEWKEILIIVGPKGDLTQPELAKLKENNFQFVRLSSHILKAETAAIFAVGLINYCPAKPL